MWLEPLLSLVDFAFYGQAMRRSTGRALAYLLYVCGLFAFTSAIAMYRKAQPLVQESVAWAAREVPEIRIEGGKASAKVQGPLRLQHPSLPWLSVLIDTERKAPVDLKEMGEKKVFAYLTQDRLYVAPMPERLETYDLSKLSAQGPVTLDAEFYRGAAALMSKILYPLSFLVTWVLFFVWKAATTFVYAFLGLMLNFALSSNLDRREIFHLSVYAQTPVIVLQAAHLFIPKRIEYFPALSLLVGAIYLWQAMRVNAREAPSEEETT